MSDPGLFALWVRERRKELDLTQEGLAQRAGLSASAVWKIEVGQRKPSLEAAQSLAEALRVLPEDRARFLRLARGVMEREKAPPSNLPAQLTPLLGREEELDALVELLTTNGVRLVTVTGSPGIGKTRLALGAAERLAGRFPDGVFMVPLAPVLEGSGVMHAIAGVLGLLENHIEPVSITVREHLQSKKMLLLLDNFEHIMSAATVVSDLMERCPNLKVLVTSREGLRLRGERQVQVPPLATPDPAGKLSANEMLEYGAVRLYVDRAREAASSFEFTAHNAGSIAAICAYLDGVPLAIELVAARSRLLSPSELSARLQGHGEDAVGGKVGNKGSSLQVLGSGARDLPERHRTLRNAISWSYNLLTSEERLFFNRLSVFVGGCSLSTAEAVCNAAGDLGSPVLDLALSLLQKSLLKEGAGDRSLESRFSMLETVREYALEQLEASGEAAIARQRHAEYFMAMASSFDPQMVGENEILISRLLDQDYDNVRAALASAIQSRPLDMALPFGLSLCRYWELRGYYTEGRDWLERITSAPTVSGETDPAVRTLRAKLILHAGRLSLYMNDYAAARTFLEECLATAAELGLESIMTSAQGNLAHVACMQGDYTTAIPLYELYMRAVERSGNVTGIANVNWALGKALGEIGDFERAESFLRESLARGRELKDTFVIFGALRDLGMALCYKGEYQEAGMFLEEAIALAQQTKNRVGVSWAIYAQGLAALGQGAYDRAEQHFRDSLELARTTDKQCVPESLEGLAEIQLARATRSEVQHGLRRAATLLGAAEAVRRATNRKIIPIREPVHERLISGLQTRLDAGVYRQSYTYGRQLSLEEVFAYV